MKCWAKIVHDEGVVHQKKYGTPAEASAFVDGFNACMEALDVEDDAHCALTDEQPARDEEDPALQVSYDMGGCTEALR